MPERPLKDKVVAARARLPDELRRRLSASHQRYKTNDTEVIVELLEAYVDAVEEADAVRFPVIVLLAEKKLMAAEDRPPDKQQRHRGDGPRRAVS